MTSNNWSPFISTVGDRCCGCGACVAVCPVTCLSLEPDACGFIRPIYESGCIGCGRCGKVCPVLSVGATDGSMSVSWAKARDDGLRGRSSSGAVFGLLAEDVLRSGGVVYGAAFAGTCRAVRHVRVAAMDNLDAIMRSKYVQSSVGVDVYKSVERDIRDGRRVLFSGTACQIAAIRNCLGLKKAPTDSLLLIDVICHGVPSPRLWAKWLDYVSCSAGAEVDSVNFRSKSTGWSNFSVAYYVASEQVRTSTNSSDWYMKAFLQNASLRQSCLDCPAKRCCGSDITLGDFWGIQDYHPEALDDLGVSAVICNTEKGVEVFSEQLSSIQLGQSTMSEVASGNSALVHSVVPHPRRNDFLADVASDMDISDLMRKWTFELAFKQKMRKRISMIINNIKAGL